MLSKLITSSQKDNTLVLKYQLIFFLLVSKITRHLRLLVTEITTL